MREKLETLADAIDSIADGSIVALGGNTLHRAPCAAVHEMVRRDKRRLTVVKTAGAYDVDLLSATGCLAAAACGYVGFETAFGLAPNYRRAVESGAIRAEEHACYTVIAGLRAAIQGVPFMPVVGLDGSDLPAARGFQRVTDPYTGEAVIAIRAMRPDVALIHVQEADSVGNARIVGTRFEDVLMAQAAARVIVTAERIVDGSAFEAHPEIVAIPSFLVDAVVHAPNGAWPTSCAGFYDYDDAFIGAYLAASHDPQELAEFVARRVLADPTTRVAA